MARATNRCLIVIKLCLRQKTTISFDSTQRDVNDYELKPDIYKPAVQLSKSPSGKNTFAS